MRRGAGCPNRESPWICSDGHLVTTTEKHHVISPHGIPLTHEPFQSKALAEEFIPKFCVQMRRQGYYRGVGETIPLEELPGRLMVVPETGTFEAFATTMRQNQERQKYRGRQRGMQRGK